MRLIKLLFISLLGVMLAACGGDEGSGLPSQPDGDGSGPNFVSLQIMPATENIPVGFTQRFTATATLSDGTTKDVTNDPHLIWTSSDVTTASIVSSQASGNGLVTGVKPGTVTITASGTANGTTFSASAQLEVTNVIVTALQVTPATATVPTGLDEQFTAIATLSDGSTLDVTDDAALSWTSSDVTTASIVSSQASGNGLVTGVKPGTVTITASGTANGTTFSASAQLQVMEALEFFTTPDGIIRDWVEADTYCKGLIPAARLPTKVELQNLFVQSTSATAINQTNSDMCDLYGWPLSGLCGGYSSFYWTSDIGLATDGHWIVSMSAGNSVSSSKNVLNVTCIR